VQVLERIARLALAEAEPESAVVLKKEDEEESQEDEEEMPPPPPEEDNSFPDAPPVRNTNYIQYGGNYQPPVGMIGG
jgi:hypothetical protein